MQLLRSVIPAPRNPISTIMALSIYLLVIALVAATLYRLGKVGRRPPGCPPGPPTLPILGNIHLIPKEKAYVQFQKWAEEYGPVYSVILGTKVMIVLSSDQAVKDLLDKRSGIYSSRPEVYLGNIVSNNDRMLLMVCEPVYSTCKKLLMCPSRMETNGAWFARSSTTR